MCKIDMKNVKCRDNRVEKEMGSSHRLVRRKSRPKIQDYRSVNEQQVEDITLNVFYKPHTLSLLVLLLEWGLRICVSNKRYFSNDYYVKGYIYFYTVGFQ